MLDGKIEFDQAWLLNRRNDEKLPVEIIKSRLESLFGSSLKVDHEDYALLSFTLETGAVEQTAQKINSVLQEEFSLNDGRQIHDSANSVYYVYPELMLAMTAGLKSDEASPLSYFDTLVGWDEFKKLCREIASVAPQIRSHNTQISFQHQNYLFSVNDGAGLTTMLNTFTDFITALDLFPFYREDPVKEIKLGMHTEDGFTSPFDTITALGKLENRNRLVCIDIRAFTERPRLGDLKAFLRQLIPLESDYIFAFRVSYIEPTALKALSDTISDILYLRTIAVPPYTNEQLKQGAVLALADYSFSLSDDAWDVFFSRIAEEKSDGRFYGMQSVRKIVCEILWLKHLADAAAAEADEAAAEAVAEEESAVETADNAENAVEIMKTTSDAAESTSEAEAPASEEPSSDLTVISKADIMGLSATYNENKQSGFDKLAELIGMEAITERIREIVSQVKYSLKDSSIDRPTLHMRFTGAPGTGKTTVARILGQIFAENGILRNGYFFEYMSRDLCGEYVGQTSPKTASICRDAYGSVLFIDEAYALYSGESNNDYGKEALATLISEMENHRDDMVVIMAGYKGDMDKLMEGNAGLRSRMPYQIDFPSYTKKQLTEIFMLMVRKHFAYNPELEQTAANFFDSLDQAYIDSQDFANARFVRNLYERTWSKAAIRSQMDGLDSIRITSDDFRAAASEGEFSEKLMTKHTLGFI
ncbi:MAG: AAA family ATPase [Lachnospiraceae bacterium]|nr:AAA family ATPase [Lachnospiraceae bacterium]